MKERTLTRNFPSGESSRGSVTESMVIPALIQAHWWDHLMHSRRVRKLRATLLRHGGPNLAVIIVPWTLDEPHPEAVIAAEEPEAKPLPPQVSQAAQ